MTGFSEAVNIAHRYIKLRLRATKMGAVVAFDDSWIAVDVEGKPRVKLGTLDALEAFIVNNEPKPVISPEPTMAEVNADIAKQNEDAERFTNLKARADKVGALLCVEDDRYTIDFDNGTGVEMDTLDEAEALIMTREPRSELEQDTFKEEDNSVDHPNHYGGRDNSYEVIKIIEALELGFYLGNALKYVSTLTSITLGPSPSNPSIHPSKD